MWDWIEDGGALWGLLALPLAVVLAIPGMIDLFITVRDWNRSTTEIQESLRATKGRVRGDGLQSRAIGIHNSFEAIVSVEDETHPASAFILERVTDGASVMIVGRAGAGKSELMDDLHRRSYRSANEAADALVEVVSLAALATPRTNLSLRAGAVRAISGRYRISRRAVSGLIAEAKIIVAFDGLDEVQDEVRREAVQQLTELSRQVPIIVATRPVAAGGSAEGGSALDILEAGGLHRADLQPLSWSFVEAALTRKQAPVPRESDVGATQLQNPLLLQIVLFLWQRKHVDERRFLASLVSSRALLRQFALGGVPAGKDRALRFLGLMAADHEKSTEAPFRMFPVQLAGRAFTVTTVVVVAAIAVIGWTNELWVTAPVLIIAVLSASPYRYGSFVGRMLSGWTNGPSWSWMLVAIVYGFVVVQVVRVVSWSIQAGALELGDGTDLVSFTSILLAFWVAIFTVVSPMQLEPHPFTYTRYMQRHAWPMFVFFVALLILLLVFPAGVNAFLPLITFIGMTCVYVIVCLGLAWRICGAPPWKWKALVHELESRGIVTRTGTAIKLVHREIEDVILHSLAADPATPKLLWACFAADWPSRLIESGPTVDDDESPPQFASTIRRLALRDAWSIGNVNAVVCYYQWVSIEPAAALSLMRAHLRRVPFSLLRAMIPDALDRTGQDGLTPARRALSRPQKSAFAVNWLLRVIERHESATELIATYRRIDERCAGSAEVAALITRRRLVLLLDDLTPADEQALTDHLGTFDDTAAVGDEASRAALVLEGETPDTALARSILREAGGGSLVLARYAQLSLIEGSPDTARYAATLAVAQLTSKAGYLATLEVMVTALIATGSDDIAAWIERAIDSGLSIQGRPGLRRNLGVSADSPASRLFASSADGSTASVAGVDPRSR